MAGSFSPGRHLGHLGHNLQGFGGLVTHLHAAYVLSILPSIISHFCHALITFKKWSKLNNFVHQLKMTLESLESVIQNNKFQGNFAPARNKWILRDGEKNTWMHIGHVWHKPKGWKGGGGRKRQILLFPSVSKETKSTAAGQTERRSKTCTPMRWNANIKHMLTPAYFAVWLPAREGGSFAPD